MSILVPPAVNYQSPLVSIPTQWQVNPPEGPRFIPFEIDWGVMGGPNQCVAFSLQSNAAQTFSRLIAISLDNSQCGADVQFIFPDTSQTYTIPAYSPYCVIQVFTSALTFNVVAIGDEIIDVTRGAFHNVLPPPMAVPASLEQNTAAIAGLSIVPASGNSVLVASTVYGTVEAMSVSFAMNNAATGQVVWSIQDGVGKVIAAGEALSSNGTASDPPGIQLSGLSVRFQQGLRFVWVTSGSVIAPSVVNANIYYRTP